MRHFSKIFSITIMTTVLVTAALLSACASAPSPQDTSPTKSAKCNVLRARMMQVGHQNNTSNAIQDTEQQGLLQTYKDECE